MNYTKNLKNVNYFKIFDPDIRSRMENEEIYDKKSRIERIHDRGQIFKKNKLNIFFFNFEIGKKSYNFVFEIVAPYVLDDILHSLEYPSVNLRRMFTPFTLI